MYRPTNISKVTFVDFLKVVQFYCGADKYSSYQIKFVFKDLATGLDRVTDQSTLDGAFIRMQEFKDTFYPGKRWEVEYDAFSEERKNKERADDNSSVTS